MAEVDSYVEALSGEEIITDLCSELAEKLRKDCNLRDSDSYQGGYSAKITVHLECYGMDTAKVDATVVSGKQQSDPDELLDTNYEIETEPALNKVRERSEQPVPTMVNDGGVPVVRQRRYVSRDKKTQGGATGETLE